MSPAPFHDFLRSPLGWIGVAIAVDGKVGRLEVVPGGPSDETMVLSAPNRSHAKIMGFLKAQLHDYFHLSCQTFNIPIRLDGSALEQRVWAEILMLQFGQCVTLQVLSDRLGVPPREVAPVIRANPVAILVPTHRVFSWENEPAEWLGTLRRLEDIVPGESTCLMSSSLPNTPQEMARATAMATPATLRPRT